MLKKNLSLLKSIVVVLIGCVGLMANVSAQEKILDFFGEVKDDDQSGYRDYVEMGCWQCHGFQGRSSRGVSPRDLAPGPLPYKVFARIVRLPPNVMPAYSPNVLSDEKLARIYAYLQSIPPAPDVSDIPILSGK
jgi:mono/diheme cytochrome c family protein